MALANYLYSLVYSDTYDKEQWQNWAYGLIKDLDYNDNTEWLFDVYMADTKEDLFKVIRERKTWIELYTDNYCVDEIIQGYYFDQYRRGLLSLYDLLERSGDIADGSSGASMGCEFFYQCLSDIIINPKLVDSPEFLKQIYDYFNPLYCVAMAQKGKLESATPESLDAKEKINI